MCIGVGKGFYDRAAGFFGNMILSKTYKASILSASSQFYVPVIVPQFIFQVTRLRCFIYLFIFLLPHATVSQFHGGYLKTVKLW